MARMSGCILSSGKSRIFGDGVSLVEFAVLQCEVKDGGVVCSFKRCSALSLGLLSGYLSWSTLLLYVQSHLTSLLSK